MGESEDSHASSVGVEVKPIQKVRSTSPSCRHSSVEPREVQADVQIIVKRLSISNNRMGSEELLDDFQQ